MEEVEATRTGLPWARFDDLRAGRALVFPTPEVVLRAVRPEQVPGVLQEVDGATAAGAWAWGYVAYEAASGLDPLLPAAAPPPGLPLAWFGVGAPPRAAEPVPAPHRLPAQEVTWRPHWSDGEHHSAVVAVRRRIADGETYQVNLTDRLCAEGVDALALYARLAAAQRGAYNAYLDLGEHAVASASPELFFEWAGSDVLTRPMKGTAARGRTAQEDEQRRAALLASPKERAENLMVVDLLRNDLHRVAEPGSVIVEELFAAEQYPTVWQLTSAIRARLRRDIGLPELFRALFPCGSVTGAPKRRTMQIIAELEPLPRGVYCGAVGYVAPASAPVRARFSVAIRTAVVQRGSGSAVYGAGGGITWGSEPAAERSEVLAKTAVLTHDALERQLVETMAWTPAEGLRHRDRHLDRLVGSARWAGFPLDRAAVAAGLDAAVAPLSAPAKVRLLLDRGGRWAVEVADLPERAPGPVRLAVSDWPVDSGWAWLQHKSTRREVYLERAARLPGVDDVVLVNERGEVTETTVANLAVRLEGRWWTPPLGVGCLPGVERTRLVERGELGERVLRVDDLLRAEALALVSSVRGWRAACLPALAAPAPP